MPQSRANIFNELGAVTDYGATMVHWMRNRQYV